MKIRKLVSRIIASIIGLLVFTAHTSERKSVFDGPKNLQVLPKNISSQQLSDTMKGFAMGLGLRCENCHIGEAGKPLTTFDFASDEKPLKRKARLMLKMVNHINGKMVPKLNVVETSDRVEVRCVTCHRGQQKPLLIQDILQAAADTKKAGAISEKYRELRKQYYGSHTYDFSEFVLPMFAQKLLSQNNLEEAVSVLKTNSEMQPDSYYGHFSLGMVYEKRGEVKMAIKAYQRALAIDPKAKWLQQKLQELINKGA